MSEHLYSFACRFICVVGLLLAGLLFVGAFLSTCYSTDMLSQEVLTRIDNPIGNLLGLALFLFVFFLAAKFFQGKKLLALRILVLLWVVIFGALLVLFGKTVPAADALSVYRMAESLSFGDTSVIDPTLSYLSYYPQQVGLMAFFEILIRLIHLLPTDLPPYHFIKCFYVLLVLAIILFQEGIVRLLLKSDAARCFYLLLAGCNLPFLMYSSFVYGEIPSFAALTVGLYCLVQLWCDKEKDTVPQSPRSRQILLCAAAVLFFAVSVALRKNNLIFMIALLIVLIFSWIRNKHASALVLALVICISSFGILPLTTAYYEARANSQIGSGVTATSYLAMGMQESSRANGWYNGFNFNTYQESGMDSEIANEISRAAISERLAYFSEHPGYAFSFYLEKHLSQWADGTYASRQATLATYGGRTPLFDNLYEGNLSHAFIEYANFYQNLLYLGFFVFCLHAFRKKENHLELFIGIIWIFGGFLFHIFWEANARYILAYSLMMMPYAAGGLLTLQDHFLAWRQKRTMPRKHKGNTNETSKQA